MLLLPNFLWFLLGFSHMYVVQGTYHNHRLWFIWLGYKDIKMLLSSTHLGQHLCNKILTFNSHSCMVGKFYWSKCWCFPPTFGKRPVSFFFLKTWGKFSRRVVSLVSKLRQSIEAVILKNAVSEQLYKCVAPEKSQDDFVKLKTVSKICCSSSQSSRRCGWGR